MPNYSLEQRAPRRYADLSELITSPASDKTLRALQKDIENPEAACAVRLSTKIKELVPTSATHCAWLT